MDRESYLAQLRQGNGYCGCDSLEKLFQLRRTAEGLERAAGTMTSEADLERPRRSEGPYLERCKAEELDAQAAAQKYERELGLAINQETVTLAKHSEEDERSFPVTLAEARSLLPGGIITANCSSCGQQIDIIEEI